MRVLVLNSGSSSVKYQLVDSDTGERLAGGMVEEVVDHAAALREVVAAVEDLDEPVDAIGHRVVHGGDVFSAPTLVDDELVEVVRRLVPLAPLHNPANLAGHRGGEGDMADGAAGRRVRHRVPPHVAAGCLPVRRADGVVRGARRASLRLPRDVARVRVGPGRGRARAAA